MGFLPCPRPPMAKTNKTQSHDVPSPPSSSSLSSQPSLPSVPTLSAASPPPSAAICAAAFKAHSSYVFALAVAGKHLLSGSHGGEISLRRRTSPEAAAALPAPLTAAGVKSLVVSGDKLFSAHQDHKIRVWKIEEGKNDVVKGENSPLRCVATLPTLKDRFLTLFSAENYVKVRRHVTRTWVHHVDTVSALAVSRDGTQLYSASWDRTVKIWRTSDFKCLESIVDAHDDAINAVVVSYDGLIYTGSADKKIKVWKREKEGKRRHSLMETLEKHKSAVNALALTQNGDVLYSGACDRSVVVWERAARGGMAVVGALRGHSKAILCLAAVGENLLCTGSADKTVRVWRRQGGGRYACLAALEGHARPVKCLAAAVDGGSYVVYSGGLDCDIRVWRISELGLSL